MRKKLLRQYMISLGIVGIVLVTFTLIIYYRGIPKCETSTVDFEVDYTSANIDKGKKIVEMACKSCHYDHGTGQLTGRFMTNFFPSLGKVYSSNITNHKGNGIGAWSDVELAYFLGTGIRPNGQFVPSSFMSRAMYLSDEDLQSLIAFLRSDDTLVKSHSKKTTSSKASLKTKLKYTFNSIEKIPYPKQSIQRPDNENTIALGKYLTLNFECFSCHTDNKNQNLVEPEKSIGYLAGGKHLLDKNANFIVSPNITMDNTGIGNWDKSDFVLAVKHGINPTNNQRYQFPMQAYTELSKHEIEAIFDYIQTINPVKNQIRTP